MTTTKTLKSAAESRLLNHYRVKCPHCGEELIISTRNLQKDLVLFKPKEEAYIYWQGEIGNVHKQIGTRLVSSDRTKDVVNIKCCTCGHVWDELADKVIEGRCDYKGENNVSFEFSESESKKIREFQEQHAHAEEFRKMGKIAFSALGQQFTYTITPGGLGPVIKVKCNFCKAEQDCTCPEEW